MASFNVNENTTVRVSGQFTDETGAVIGSGSMQTLAVTLYDRATGAAINGRTGQNVLNANGGTLDVSGNFALQLDPADTAIIGTDRIETHVLRMDWTWSSGNKAGRAEMTLVVNNLVGVP